MSEQTVQLSAYRPSRDLLQGRVILVTGAGQGIGRVAALEYAAHGATVVLQGRKPKKLEAVYETIQQAGYPEPAMVPLDLNTAADTDFERLADTIESELGRLDGILHSAVLFEGLKRLSDLTLEHWLACLRVNLAAPAALNRACAPLLATAPDAAVIVTGETHGLAPAAFWGAFAAAKAGLAALVRIQAEEWVSTPQLRINLVVPGPVRSPQRTQSHPAEAPEQVPAVESVMPWYLYFMGPASRGRSGEIIRCARGEAP
ncbi:MAG: SDR family NAD(P)-dependent oxidoreductase [Burkholderiales bacterium]